MLHTSSGLSILPKTRLGGFVRHATPVVTEIEEEVANGQEKWLAHQMDPWTSSYWEATLWVH